MQLDDYGRGEICHVGRCPDGCTNENGGCKGTVFRREHAVAYMRKLAEQVVGDAIRYGVVLTITTEPTLPLRMGGHQMVIDVRKARELAAPVLKGVWE